MVQDEKIKLVSDITDSLLREGNKSKQLYAKVITNRITTVELINELEEISNNISLVQANIATVTGLKA